MSTAFLPEDIEDLENPEELPDDGDEGRNEKTAAIGAWGISIIVHAIALLLLLVVVFSQQIRDQAPVQTQVFKPPPPVEEQEKERELVEREVTTEIEAEVQVEQPQVTELDVPVEEIETEDPEISENPAQGRQEAVAASEMGGAGAFMAIGAGGGAAGAFGNRSGGGRRQAVGRFGGSKASESAVEAALRWFARHQSPNGQWDLDGYPANCKLPGPKCEPGVLGSSIVINKVNDKQHTADVAMTGYAILCFLGAGYDHASPNKFRNVVKNGLDWLRKVQAADGLMGSSNYEHPIATMALVEAYGMTKDPSLRNACERAVAVILERQVRTGDGYGFGWAYFEADPGRVDSSVTGWPIMALKSAKAAGLDVGDGLTGAKVWLEEVWKAHNPNWAQLDAYDGKTGFPYTYNVTSGTVTKDQNGPEDLTCVGALAAVFLGYRQGDVLLETLANTLHQDQFQKTWPLETYYLYYSTLAIFQVGGERWQDWNSVVRDLLIEQQRKTDDCFDGSWDQGTRTSKVWGQRMLATAYCCLSLEVYYRYLPVAMQK